MQKKDNLKDIWGLVVAATIWTIWLSRNEAIFNKTKQSKATIGFLILTRFKKWGKAVKLIDFGEDPLWIVSPQGAITTHLHVLNKTFWNFKTLSYDIVCAVDGAWGQSMNGSYAGGIGGG